MKGDAYVLVTGLMIAALANLPEIHSQECFFFSETQPITEEETRVNITETEPKGEPILNLRTSFGNLSCSDFAATPFSTYINYSHTENNTQLNFFMKQEIGEDLDNGDLNEAMLLIENCELSCPQANLATQLKIYVTILDENTQIPKFNFDYGNVTLEENFPKGFDFSYLLKVDNEPLSVSDKDLPFQNISFYVSDERFYALNTSIRKDYNDSYNGHPRIMFEPQIVVKSQLNAAESPIKFNLIAKDSGNPPKESLFPITVTIIPQDVRDPEFENYYYKSIIPNSTFKGTLKVEPQNILAKDGDKTIDVQLRYDITNSGGLNVKLKNTQPDKGVPVEIELNTEVEGSPTDKMRYIVIMAIQTDDKNRNETVVLAVELPQPVLSTTTTTTMSSTMTTPSSTTEQTYSSCAPCTTESSPDATTIATSCPTFDPTTHCPTGSPTGDPVSTLTTDSVQTTTICPTTITSPISPSSSTTPTHSPNISKSTSPTTSVTSTETEGTLSSISSCPICPVTTDSVTICPTTECPTIPTECPTCPTENTEVSCSSPATELPPNTVPTFPTSCPITCPAPTTTSPLICDCSTTPAAATCPTTAIPPTRNNSSVQFEKQQYASEILENSPVNTFIVKLSAMSTIFNEKPEYSFAEGYDTKYFVVDSKTGNVTTAVSLPVGNYLLDAIAQIPSGDKDHARIVVSSVMGTSCNGTQFSSPLYEFPISERTTGKVGQVELRSTDTAAYTLSISSCSPPSMAEYFKVEPNGNIVVISPFNWTNNCTRIILTISAENQKHSRMMPISTIVNIDVLDINEAPQFLGYGSSMVIGYPDRTYFDPSVQMPLIKVKANDVDNEENATLTYHVMNEFEIFDIDLQTGSLFVKGIDKLDWETIRTVQIVARDKHGLEDTLNITVKPLSDNYITLMKAKSQTDSLTEETVSNDMSRILGYQVVVLRIEKSPDISLRVTQSTSLIGYNYKVTLYALNKTTFITREEFTQKVNGANTTGLSWTIDGKLSIPQEYQVEKTINTLTKDTQSYTIATAVLGTLLGLVLILIVVYVIYVKKFKVERPWSQAFRAASLEVDKKHWDQRSFAQSSDHSDETSEAHIDSYNRELSGKINEGGTIPVIRFSMEKSIYNANIQANQTPIEDEAYCPPTPVPKKSILKDSSITDKNSKQRTNVENKLEDTSVKFSPTPEVIQVAATAPEVEEVDLDNSNKDDDDEFLIEEL